MLSLLVEEGGLLVVLVLTGVPVGPQSLSFCMGVSFLLFSNPFRFLSMDMGSILTIPPARGAEQTLV